MRTLLVTLALLGAAAAGTATADVKETVVVVGAGESCNDATPERARWLADRASRDRDYQRAGECYLAAGQHSQADEAFVKASAQSKGDTSKRLASNLNDFKTSARQMKQALQHR
jgi:hypothetical protein